MSLYGTLILLLQGSVASEEAKQLRTEIDKIKVSADIVQCLHDIVQDCIKVFLDTYLVFELLHAQLVLVAFTQITHPSGLPPSSYLSHAQPPQDKLMFPLTFKWKKQNNLPYATSFEYLCIVSDKVYICKPQVSGILVHNPDTDTWVTLPTPTKQHGIVSLNGKLTLVGGLLNESTFWKDTFTSKIRVWDNDSKQWTEPYPPMLVERRDVGCASYLHYLIIIGGHIVGNFQSTTSVEILDTKSGQWFKAPPMPYNGENIQSIIIGTSLYVLFTWQGVATHSKSLLRVSLPTLISHTLQGKNHDTSIWEKMPDVSFYNTTLFSIGNMLLTAGGNRGTLTVKPSADIYLFNPHTNKWVKIGELPESRFSCACTVLPSGKLLVAGGQGKDLLSTVYTATIAGSYFEPAHF